MCIVICIINNKNTALAPRQAKALHTVRPVEACPYCEGNKITRKGRRKNKYGDIQLYYCHHCRRRFSPLVNKNRTYPLRVIIEALSLYNRHNSYQQTADLIAKKFGLRVSRQIVRLWVMDYEDYLLFKPLRDKAAKIMPPQNWISESRLLHGLVYSYKYHRAKTELIIRAGKKRHAGFVPLQCYLEEVPLSCPHDLFRKEKPRASAQRHCFDLTGVKITPRHDNAAVQSARFVLQAVANNKRRHETVQDFMLVNDSATIAAEVPILLKAEDLQWFIDAAMTYRSPLNAAASLPAISTSCKSAMA
jgi:transposase-like protein